MNKTMSNFFKSDFLLFCCILDFELYLPSSSADLFVEPRVLYPVYLHSSTTIEKFSLWGILLIDGLVQHFADNCQP